MKKFLLTICLGGLVATGAQAQQSSFNYNYIQAGYGGGTMTVGGATLDTSGFGLGASVALGDSGFVTASYGDGRLKVGALTVNQSDYAIGVGGHASLGKQTDFVGGVSYVGGKISVLGYWETATGLGFDVGLRHAVTDKLEVNGGLSLAIMGSDHVQTTSLGVGARYKVAEKVSLGVGFVASSNESVSSRAVNGNVRFEF